jgi:hypothetical protein
MNLSRSRFLHVQLHMRSSHTFLAIPFSWKILLQLVLKAFSVKVWFLGVVCGVQRSVCTLMLVSSMEAKRCEAALVR